ncbi:MAG TPA: DUF4132 domain-containing protein [Gemmataceae bacterium]|nr:DUF4132 domain-containing protein [Gemmataceae bacterium]
MSRLQQALTHIRQNGTSLPLKDIQRFLETGDAKVLERIKPASKKSWWWEGNTIADALSPPGALSEEDVRALQVLTRLGFLQDIGRWLNGFLAGEKREEDLHGTVRKQLSAHGAKESDFIGLTATVENLVRDGQPTSAGRYLLSLSDRDLQRAVKESGHDDYLNLHLVELILDFAPDRVPALQDELLRDRGHESNTSSIADLLLTKCGKRFEKDVAAFFASATDPYRRFEVGAALAELDQARYGKAALEAARASLQGPSEKNIHDMVANWMLGHFGKEVLADVVDYFAASSKNTYPGWQDDILAATVKTLGKDALPAVLAALKNPGYPKVRLDAIGHLIALDDGTHERMIQSELEACFDDKQPSFVVQAIGTASRWKVAAVAERLWKLLGHSSRPVRTTAARTLAQLGDAALPRAGELLLDKKTANREAAVTLLTSVNSSKALKILEDRLDDEPDDDVRDAILLGLEAASAKSGRAMTWKDVKARIDRAADRFKGFSAAWLKEGQLPPLKLTKGGALDKDAVRYLLYRQSRAKEIRPDIEAKPLFALIDRKNNADFALAVLKGFLASKTDASDRWALTIAGLLGDDRMVPLLNQQIRKWADTSRGKMAEFAVAALALLGTDTALLALDALAIRYRTKYKNIGKAAVEAFALAAERLGMSVEELGDRVVPWLGFEPGKPRLVEAGKSKIEARIGLDFKLKYHDLEKKKSVSALPKAAPKVVLAEFKELGAHLREIAKAQTMRLENLMVRQHHWPAPRWRDLFLRHPLLFPFAVRHVWGLYGEDGGLMTTFRALEDGSLTNASDEAVAVPGEGSIGVVHPLELGDEARKAWLTHLADYEIEPAFPQLERPVVHLAADQKATKSLHDYKGTSLNAMTFKGRAERLGWMRGSVVDAGGVLSYWKSFPTAGVDAFLGLEDMYVGIDMYSDIKLQEAYFVRTGSVKTGSYTYDEPGKDDDARLLSFGQVPPIVYSEVMGDLQKIAGKKADATGEE